MVATRSELEAIELDPEEIETYLLRHQSKPKLTLSALAKARGITPSKTKIHLARVKRRLADPESIRSFPERLTIEGRDPAAFADAVIELSTPGSTIASSARAAGISTDATKAIANRLDNDLVGVGRPIKALKLQEITDEFGQLALDAVRAITPEKLEEARARDLAVISGVAIDTWQLLRGQPTSRMEISDRRKLDEVAALLMKEAARRGVTLEIDPVSGETHATASPYRNIHDQRRVKELSSGDPVVEV